MYDYDTPDGYSDVFFIYVFDAKLAGLNNGADYTQQGVKVTDGAFVCRAWNGAYSVLDGTPGSWGTIQLYGRASDQWFDNPTVVYTPNPGPISVLPEKEYPVDGIIKFDLTNVKVRLI